MARLVEAGLFMVISSVMVGLNKLSCRSHFDLRVNTKHLCKYSQWFHSSSISANKGSKSCRHFNSVPTFDAF